MSITIAIIEEDKRFLKYLVDLIDSTEGFRCVGQITNAENALKEIDLSPPDVVLMDIHLSGLNGVANVRQLKERFPDVLIVMLTDFENINIIFSALSSGACGYLLKHSSPEQIIAGVREAFEGGSPISSAVARQLVILLQQAEDPVENYGKLSIRQRQVIACLAEGCTYMEIAKELKISYATVHTHIRHIYEKLQVGSRTGAVVLHLRHIATRRHHSGVKFSRITDYVAMNNLV